MSPLRLLRRLLRRLLLGRTRVERVFTFIEDEFSNEPTYIQYDISRTIYELIDDIQKGRKIEIVTYLDDIRRECVTTSIRSDGSRSPYRRASLISDD